jgi:CHAT domain-containing protein
MSGSQLKIVRSQLHPSLLIVTRVVFLIFVPLVFAYQDVSKKLPDFEKSIKSASNLLRAGEYRGSEAAFQRLLDVSEQRRNDYYAARSRIGLAACQFMIHNYKAAVANAETALRYGLATKDPDIAVRAGLNLSSVYRRMKDFSAAAHTLRELNPLIPEITDIQAKTQLYLHAATNFSRGGDWERAEPLFHAAIDSSLQEGDLQTAAAAWNQLGYMRLQHNELERADAALTEAFRIRRFAGNHNLSASYIYLGMLRLAQGDAVSARNLLDNAIHLAARTDAAVPGYVLYYWRAKAKTATLDIKGAFADFEKAVNLATRWRQEVLPTDGFRITAEVGLDLVYDDYVQAGMQAWEASKDSALARRMFEVSEEHRSASFREMQRNAKPLPAEYWEALAQYRSALATTLASATDSTAEPARVQLARVESALGLKADGESRVKLSNIQGRLTNDEALLSFHTGDEKSYVWAITKNGFVSHVVPGRRQLAPVAKRYREGLERNAPLATAGADLHTMLFGKFGAQLKSKRDWLLSLDRGLFDVPFAALGPDDTPLVLSHSLRTIPGAGLLTRPAVISRRRAFVGAGDAIYNSADPRWKGKRTADTAQFARLINTQREVRSVAKAWTIDQKPTLLFGESFNRAALEQAVRAEPAIVHIAAHVVQGQTDAANVMIGVGLLNDGTPDFLTPADIAVRRAPLGLVTINGCASGAGAALPGAGLIGLTRAWLLGGASAVAATYWPVEDDRGELFSTMYHELVRSGSATITPSKAARALQSAQISAFRSAGPRSAANVWAAVFLAGKQ